MRLLVVDDHAPTRAKIIAELTTGGMIEVCGQAESSDDAWKLAQKLLPDMVLLDLHLPGLISTLDLIKRLCSLRNAKVVIFASQGKASEVQDLLDAGAAAYVLKEDAPALIRMTMLMVSRGSRNVISPSLPRHLTRLSHSERNLLRHVTARGGIAKAAERLAMSDEQLANELEQLTAKLELEDIDELVSWAKKHDF